MRYMLFAAAALAALTIGANASHDRLPAEFAGDWCLAEHIADHLAFYRRGRCENPDNVDDNQSRWLRGARDALQGARGSREQRGDYLAKFWCDDNLIQNYWFSLVNDRLYISQTDREP
jgi:hypothetical protein